MQKGRVNAGLDVFRMDRGQREKAEKALNKKVMEPLADFLQNLPPLKAGERGAGVDRKKSLYDWMSVLNGCADAREFEARYENYAKRKRNAPATVPDRVKGAAERYLEGKKLGIIELMNGRLRLNCIDIGMKYFTLKHSEKTRQEAEDFVSSYYAPHAPRRGIGFILGKFRSVGEGIRKTEVPAETEASDDFREILKAMRPEAEKAAQERPEARTGMHEAHPAEEPEKIPNGEIGVPAETGEMDYQGPERPKRNWGRRFRQAAAEAWSDTKRDCRIVATLGKPALTEEEKEARRAHRKAKRKEFAEGVRKIFITPITFNGKKGGQENETGAPEESEAPGEEMGEAELRLRQEHEQAFREELAKEMEASGQKKPAEAVPEAEGEIREEEALEPEAGPKKKAVSAKTLRYAAVGIGVAAITALGGYGAYYATSRAPLHEVRTVQPATQRQAPKAEARAPEAGAETKEENAPAAEETPAKSAAEDRNYAEAQRKIRLMRIERKAAEIRARFAGEESDSGQNKAEAPAETAPSPESAPDALDELRTRDYARELAKKAKDDPFYAEAYSFITSKFREDVQDSVARGVLSDGKEMGREKIMRKLEGTYRRAPQEFRK